MNEIMRKWPIIPTMLVCAVLLAPILFFPVSSDLSIFVLGGKTILSGDLLYADYMDLKPPLIYYLFAAITGIFGTSEIGLRLFDFLMQLSACLLIYRIIIKVNGPLIAATASAIIYSISYTSLNFNQTLQAESFISLPLLLITYIHISDSNSKWSMLLQGAAIGFLAGLKFTFGILIIGVFLDDLLRRKYSAGALFSRTALSILSMASILLLSFLPLLNPESMAGYKDALSYIAFYSTMPPVDIEFFKATILRVGLFFGDNYSLFLFILMAGGIGKAVLGSFKDADYQRILRLMAVFALILFLSVVSERKYYEYHFLRMFVPLAVLAGAGFSVLWQRIKTKLSEPDTYPKILLLALFLLALVFSPAPRWLNTLRIPAAYVADRDRYDQIFEQGGPEILRKQHRFIAEFIRKNRKQSDKLIVISTGGNAINYMLRDMRISKYSQSCFYYSIGALERIKKDFSDELRQVDWIVVQNNDEHLHINGHKRSSWKSLQADTLNYNYVSSKFCRRLETENFIVFRKNESTNKYGNE